jgi:hypothetical protein
MEDSGRSALGHRKSPQTSLARQRRNRIVLVVVLVVVLECVHLFEDENDISSRDTSVSDLSGYKGRLESCSSCHPVRLLHGTSARPDEQDEQDEQEGKGLAAVSSCRQPFLTSSPPAGNYNRRMSNGPIHVPTAALA